jgi:hypothetical protein
MAAQATDKALQASDLLPVEETTGLGRPSTYSPAVAELICARLAGGETLADICRTRGMPHRQTVHRWRMKYDAFDTLYYRARSIGMEQISDDTVAIADDDTHDIMPDGSPNPTNVNRARLMVHARHFLMGKLARHVYGDKVEHQHSGEVVHSVDMSDRERMRRLASFMLEDQRAGVTVDGQASALPDSPALPDRSAQNEPRPIDEPRVRDDDV